MHAVLQLLAAVAVSTGLVAGAPTELRLPRVFTSSMVLQADRPRIYGWGPPNAGVTVTTSDGQRVTEDVDGSGNFSVMLPPRQAQIVPVGVSITVAAGGKSITLDDVLFGDVWVCSGQSNMEFSVAEAFDHEEIISTANIEGLRLFAVQKNGSTEEVDDVIDVMSPGGGWVRSNSSTVCGAEYDNNGYSPWNTSAYCKPHCGPTAADHSFSRATWGYFSAACFLHGREMLRRTNRPQGMVESCWGGTAIQKWSSQSALSVCTNDTHVGGDLWGGMIAPLLKMPVAGAIWYQGEANAGTAAGARLYTCEMAAMIADWRKRWEESGSGSGNLTFVMAALAPEGGSFSPIVRYAQWGAAAATFFGGVPPWGQPDGLPALTNVGIANLIDLYDAESPCKPVHIRNKTAVGERLAAAALGIAGSTAWNGPVPMNMTFSEDGIQIRYRGSGGGNLNLGFETLWWNDQTTDATDQSFSVLCGATWTNASAIVVGTNVVAVRMPCAATADLAAIAYAWSETPSGQQLIDRRPSPDLTLPAMPFFASCNAGSCALVSPSDIPDGPGPRPRPRPGPPPPLPPGPPAPPAPPSTSCTLRNHTDITGATELAQVEVGLFDTAGCCGACRANPACVRAELYGSGKKSPPFGGSKCVLYSTAGTQKPFDCPFPCARVAITPTKM